MDLYKKILELDTVYEGDGQQGGFQTNDPKEAIKEIVKRMFPGVNAQIPISKNLQLNLGPNVNEISAGGQFDVGGGELSIGGGMRGDDKAFGFTFRKPFADGSDDRRMYSGRMMTEEQIQAIRDRRKVPKKEGMVYDKETKEFRPRKESVISEKMSEASAEVKATKTKNKLENFIKDFKETNGRLPGIMEIRNGAKASTKSIKKYLTEGIDYTKTSLTEAAVKGGQKSAIVRAVPEGQDPSYVTRYKTLQEANKFLSAQDKADFKKINEGKKFINKYFKANPEAINTTEFGKNIKQLLSFRMDKDTGAIFSKVRPDEYYIKKAKEGRLFDIFDIKAVKEGGRSLRFPTNVNLTPGQFNSVFIQNQVGKYFAKGANPEALKNVENILNKYNLRVKLPEVGYLGTDNPVAVKRATGEFPKITETLKSMKAPQIVLDQFAGAKTKELRPLANIGCPNKKADGGRVNFSDGQDLVACAIKGAEKLQNTDPKDLDGLAKSNIKKLTKTAQGARFLKNTLGPVALAYEGLFALPFAALDFAEGRAGSDILKNALSLGLMDSKLREDELKEFFPGAGQADAFLKSIESLKNLQKQLSGTKKQRERAIPKYNIAFDNMMETIQPFMRPNPQLKEGQFFDPLLIEQSQAKEADAEKKVLESYDKRLREREIGPYSKPFDFDYFSNGGIAGLSGGDKSGPPPERGPDSQGLRSLMKRGINL